MRWRELLDPLFDVLLPPSCAVCDEVLPVPGAFCDDCAWEVLELPTVHCRSCAEPGRFPHGRCERCSLERPPWAKAWAPFEHEGAVARAVHRFKYEDRADLSRPLGLLLLRHAREVLARFPGPLVPLPLHDARFRERRFDQAALLAQTVAQYDGRRVETSWLERTRATRRQVGLSEAQREANVRGAFRASSAVRGRSLVLIDDVLTSGATVREASRVLVEAGAGPVLVLTLARARSELRSAGA